MRMIASGNRVVKAEIRRAINKGVKAGLVAESHRKKAILYLNGIHEFQLHIDNKPTGELVKMLGVKAKETNNALKENFREDVRAGLNPEYKIYVCKNKFVENTTEVENLKKEFDDERYKNARLVSKWRLNRSAKVDGRVKKLEEKYK
jgi:hypothetical protein